MFIFLITGHLKFHFNILFEKFLYFKSSIFPICGKKFSLKLYIFEIHKIECFHFSHKEGQIRNNVDLKVYTLKKFFKKIPLTPLWYLAFFTRKIWKYFQDKNFSQFEKWFCPYMSGNFTKIMERMKKVGFSENILFMLSNF